VRRLKGFILFSAAVAALPLLFPDNYYVTVVGVTAMIHVILAVALNLFMGYAGQISLGHAAFFGIGAYTSAVLTVRYGVNPWLALCAAPFITYLLSLAISRPILRLKGHYLAMATLGFGIIVHIFLVQADTLTGGPDGLSGIPPLRLGSLTFDSDIEWYWLMGGLMLLVILFSLNLSKSRIGRALFAIHGSEVAAQTMGIDTPKVKSQVFILSALITTFTGSLFAHQQSFVSPDSFGFFFSVELVTMVVLGGLGSTYGAVFGAVLLSLLPELLTVFEDYEVMIYGAILMLIMIFLPKGLFVTLSEAVDTLVSKIVGK